MSYYLINNYYFSKLSNWLEQWILQRFKHIYITNIFCKESSSGSRGSNQLACNWRPYVQEWIAIGWWYWKFSSILFNGITKRFIFCLVCYAFNYYYVSTSVRDDKLNFYSSIVSLLYRYVNLVGLLIQY